MSAVKWAGTEISLRKSYFIIMAPAIITLCTLTPKPIECYNNNIIHGKKWAWARQDIYRIFTVNALAIPAVWALEGQIVPRIMCVLSFEFPLICPFQFAALISFSAKKSSRYLLCVKTSPAAVKPETGGQKRRDKLQGSSPGPLLWTLLSEQKMVSLVWGVRWQKEVSPLSPGQPQGVDQELVLPCCWNAHNLISIFRAAQFSLLPHSSVMCVYKPAWPSSAKLD